MWTYTVYLILGVLNRAIGDAYCDHVGPLLGLSWLSCWKYFALSIPRPFHTGVIISSPSWWCCWKKTVLRLATELVYVMACHGTFFKWLIPYWYQFSSRWVRFSLNSLTNLWHALQIVVIGFNLIQIAYGYALYSQEFWWWLSYRATSGPSGAALHSVCRAILVVELAERTCYYAARPVLL